MTSFYFDNSEEPDDFLFKLNNDLENICTEKGVNFIKLDFEDKDDYYNTLIAMQKFTSDNIRVSGTSREGHYEVVIDNEEPDEEVTTENENEDESNNREKNQK